MDTVRQLIWESKYRAAEAHERFPLDSFDRIASAIARREPQFAFWQQQFFLLMAANLFVPGGRILANAGRDNGITLANCFVAGTLEDTQECILATLKDCAVTLQAGGGIGIDFSPLRPHGWPTPHAMWKCAGPVYFLRLWNQMNEALLHKISRGGAMMGVLDCNHPDILEFIRAKNEAGALPHFNLSVAISDAFMHALTTGDKWPLCFNGITVDTIAADDLWAALVDGNQHGCEPGVLFIDRINAANRLNDREIIRTTNPCGELPLPPHGSCVLGSLILPSFIENPFTSHAHVNLSLLEESTRIAVRMLDNAVDMAQLPLPQQRSVANRTRRIGLGITGLADALMMLGLPYDSEKARRQAARIVATIRDAAYISSSELARERGSFPEFNATRWLSNSAAEPLTPEVSTSIRLQGLRNSHLTAIAPAGSISLLCGNVSSGIEPTFDRTFDRVIQTAEGPKTISLTDFAVQKWRGQRNENDVPPSFRSVATVSPADQIAMVAALQPYIDSAISKTVALPIDTSGSAISAYYWQAYNMGLKGLTCYSTQSTRGCVLKRKVVVEAPSQ